MLFQFTIAQIKSYLMNKSHNSLTHHLLLLLSICLLCNLVVASEIYIYEYLSDGCCSNSRVSCPLSAHCQITPSVNSRLHL